MAHYHYYESCEYFHRYIYFMFNVLVIVLIVRFIYYQPENWMSDIEDISIFGTLITYEIALISPILFLALEICKIGKILKPMILLVLGPNLLTWSILILIYAHTQHIIMQVTLALGMVLSIVCICAIIKDIIGACMSRSKSKMEKQKQFQSTKAV